MEDIDYAAGVYVVMKRTEVMKALLRAEFEDLLQGKTFSVSELADKLGVSKDSLYQYTQRAKNREK